MSLKIHKIFKCNTLSRVDLILSKRENKIYFLEINSQPGMTKMSLFPEQAKFNKIKFESIVYELINNSKWKKILIKKKLAFLQIENS